MTYLTTKQVCERYKTTGGALQKWLSKGLFPKAMKIGGASRWSLDVLIEWENRANIRPPEESAAILQALLRPAIEVSMILRGPTAGPWIELYLAKRAEHRTPEALAAFFLQQLPDALAPILETAPDQKAGDPASIVAVAMLSLALGDHAIIADLVRPFAAGISKQPDVVSYLQSLVVRIRQAAELRLSLPALWGAESRLLFAGLADAVVDAVETQKAVDAIFENVAVL